MTHTNAETSKPHHIEPEPSAEVCVDVLLRSVGPRDGQGRTAQKPRCAILEQGDGSDHTY